MIFDENTPSSTTNITNLYGYKVSYNNGNYELGDDFEKYCKFILTELYANFGLPNTIENKSSLDEKPLSSNIANYDRIRVQANTSGSVDFKPWKWTFASSYSSAQSQTDTTQTISYYTSEKQKKYFEEFSSLYLSPLQIVCMQIVMGEKQPHIFEVETSDIGATFVYYDTSRTQLVEKNDSTYLNAIKTEFKQKGKYVGFTEDNILVLKNYLLENVIGEDIIKHYNEIYFSNKTLTYSEVLDNILSISSGVAQTFYSPYPTDFIKDVTDSSLYPVQSGDLLGHIEEYEYHSVTFMPEQPMELAVLTLIFESKKDIDLTVEINYYTSATKELNNVFTKDISIKSNISASNNQLEVMLDNFQQLPVFNNEQTGVAIDTQIKTENNLSKYFSYDGKRSGLGKNIESDFCEISFIINSETSGYNSFKFGIESIWVG